MAKWQEVKPRALALAGQLLRGRVRNGDVITVGINSETGGTNGDQFTAELHVHSESEQLDLVCVGGIQAKSPIH